MIICEKNFTNSVKVGRKLICDRTLIFGEIWFPAMTPFVIHEVDLFPADRLWPGSKILNIVIAPEGWDSENKFYLTGRELESSDMNFGIIVESA